jgi:hypothetical protein
MSNYFVISEHKPILGPIASSVKATGIPVMDFKEFKSKKFEPEDNIIIFYNKVPPYVKTKAKVAWWMNDIVMPDKLTAGKVGFDFIFLCNKEYEVYYKEKYNKPVFYMPQCGIESGFTSESRKVDWEVLFIGNTSSKKYHSNRVSILERVGQDFNLKVIKGEKTTVDQTNLYAETPFNLSISVPMELVTSNRLYNILASGGFALVSWFPCIERLFKNHHHLVWFKSAEEAVDLIYHYSHRHNIGKWEEIKSNGYKLYWEKHSAQCRIDNMVDIMNGIETNFRGFYGKG